MGDRNTIHVNGKRTVELCTLRPDKPTLLGKVILSDCYGDGLPEVIISAGEMRVFVLMRPQRTETPRYLEVTGWNIFRMEDVK